MKVLAIDTSSKICSASILEDDIILISLYNDDEKTHSVKLMPMISEAFQKTNLTLDDISLLACCIGPGSFTGVRIGIATIKAFADVKKIPTIGVTSLESLAYNVENMSKNSDLVCSLIDAKNGNVYYGLYKISNHYPQLISMSLDNIDNAINTIQNNMKKENINNAIFVGDGANTYKDKILSVIANSTFVPERNLQDSISIAKVGLNKYLNKEQNSNSLSPIYLKKSQAEIALEEKIQIQPMVESDIVSISPNFEIDFDKFWNINNLKNDFSNPNSTYFTAKIGDEIVGFAGFLVICDEANIMNIVTKSSKRNIGIGTKLLNTLIDSAKKQGLKSITLEVNANNCTAIHLYEKFEFKRIGLRKKYYNNTDDAIIMSLVF